MGKDIIIFGKNSILAQNFVKNDKNKLNRFVFITRESNDSGDICCDIG